MTKFPELSGSVRIEVVTNLSLSFVKLFSHDNVQVKALLLLVSWVRDADKMEKSFINLLLPANPRKLLTSVAVLDWGNFITDSTLVKSTKIPSFVTTYPRKSTS